MNDVFVADGFGFEFDLGKQFFTRRIKRIGIRRILRVLHPLVLLFGEFRIYGQPHHFVRIVTAPWQFNGKIHHLVAVGFDFDVRSVAVWRKHVFEQVCQLHLAPVATGFNVGQHAL